MGVTGRGDPGIVGRDADTEAECGTTCREKDRDRDFGRGHVVVFGSAIDCRSDDTAVGDCR